ncbi:MAG: Dihydroorotate dehydrogenase B (NAD(+)), electron transfer subunit [Dehalococcoidia bacterium]|nr:Dihydroorotate dehydrogenase B (NAD(+)), electron transfer subunit [Chloroflexota bacterium]
MRQVPAPIVSRTQVMPGVYLIWVEAPDIAAEARPGQFVTVRCGEHLPLRRPLSIHRTDGRKLALLFAVVGQGTKWLSVRMVGESLDLLGPLGNGFEIRQGSQKLLLIAGGIGVAPLIALADEGVGKGLLVKFVIGAKTASKLYAPESGVWSLESGVWSLESGVSSLEAVELIRVTDDGSAGERGQATDFLPSLADWADQIFACGPLPMYRRMAEMRAWPGNKSVQVLLEQVMGCGVGACRGCAVVTNKGIKLVCEEGPVFELGEIVWDKSFKF